MPLNDAKCKNAKPKDKAYRLFDGQGLYLEVSPKGSRYWRMKYRHLGKENRLAHGVYPAMSLAEARELTANARKMLSRGIDPAVAKKEFKAALHYQSANNFKAIAEEWVKKQSAVWAPSNKIKVTRRLANDVYPHIGGMAMESITPPILLRMAQVVEARGAHEMARSILQYAGQVFRYAIATGRATSDPTRDLRGALQPFKKRHLPALAFKDLPQFLQDIQKSQMFETTYLATKLLMLTFVRTSELIGAKWSEVDFKEKVWEIPAERMKMKRAHIVPLSRQAIAILKQLETIKKPSGYVFPSPQGWQKHISYNTVLFAIYDMGYKGRMTGHGFRALAMTTIKEKLGYRHEVIDRQLAHAHTSKITAAYDRAEFLKERAKMMQEWADLIDTCSKIAKGGN
jgi:integrase